jgi:hypothetical protein
VSAWRRAACVRPGLGGLGFGAVALALTSPAVALNGAGEQFIRIAGIELGRVALQDVRRRYGPARVLSAGDAGDAVSSVCYWLPGLKTAVTFRSGEMGGTARDVLGVDVSGPGKRPSQCRIVDGSNARSLAQLPAGLALGAPLQAVAARLGLATPSDAHEHLRRIFGSKQRVGGALYDLTITVTARFAGTPGRLTGISVDRVLTN